LRHGCGSQRFENHCEFTKRSLSYISLILKKEKRRPRRPRRPMYRKNNHFLRTAALSAYRPALSPARCEERPRSRCQILFGGLLSFTETNTLTVLHRFTSLKNQMFQPQKKNLRMSPERLARPRSRDPDPPPPRAKRKFIWSTPIADSVAEHIKIREREGAKGKAILYFANPITTGWL